MFKVWHILADTSILCAIIVVGLYREIATGLKALAMTVVVFAWLRRIEQHTKLKFELMEETLMLKNIPAILSPELLKVLAEMGHSDRICIGDGNFPGASMAKAKNAIFLRADGHGVPEILDAILQVFPLDTYVEQPAILMEKMDCDKDLVIPVWDEYKSIIAKYDDRGADAVGNIDRFKFYDEAKDCYCILQTGETAIYANIILQKGVIK